MIETVDGAEVAKAAWERPDLVLMDIQLPALDGYDATRQIKALPGFSAIPIIAVSSFAMKGDEAKAMAAGCDHYVTKALQPSSAVAHYARVPRREALRAFGLGPHLSRHVNKMNFGFRSVLSGHRIGLLHSNGPTCAMAVVVRFGRHGCIPRSFLGGRVTPRFRPRPPLLRRTVGLCQKQSNMKAQLPEPCGPPATPCLSVRR